MIYFGIINTYFAVILAYAGFLIPIGILILRMFFEQIPGELTEAGIVDGANDIKLFDICNLGIAYRAQDLVKDLATVTLEEKDLTKIIPIINEHYSLKLPVTLSS